MPQLVWEVQSCKQDNSDRAIPQSVEEFLVQSEGDHY